MLTEKAIAQAKPREKTYRLADTNRQRAVPGNITVRREKLALPVAVYAAKLLGGQLTSGEAYKRVSRGISVLITDFPLLFETEDYHNRFQLRDESGKIVLADILELHTLELSKIPATEDGRKVWPWLKFLAAGTEEEFTMLKQTYAELQKPVARLMEMSADEIMHHQKDAWDKARWDEEARMRKARAEGLAEGEARARRLGGICRHALQFPLYLP